jgi:hypothetical protein
MTMPDEDPSLFGPNADLFLTKEQITAEERRQHRETLLAALARSDLGTIEAKVAWLLQNIIDTRDSDTELAIQYWHKWQGTVLAEKAGEGIRILHSLAPQMESITRARRRIQNTLELFQGSPRTQYNRSEIQLQFYKYMGTVKDNEPEIRFFLDESGNEPGSPVAAVGGVCIVDWRHYERFHAALSQWRSERGPQRPFHFADMSPSDEPLYMAWLSELSKYRGGLLFCGYAVEARRAANRQLRNLFLHLIVDSLHHLHKHGCLSVPRRLSVVKEREAGFDTFELGALEQDLSQRIYADFPERIRMDAVKAAVKASDVMLEYADVVAASMTRKLVHDKLNHKDRVADTVLNTTGLNQDTPGAVFKLFHESGRL